MYTEFIENSIEHQSAISYIGEVAKDVAATPISLRHHVEEERVDIEIERFVLQEQLGHQTEVLAVDFVLFSVHFEYREMILAVNFISRRMLPRANTPQ